MDLIAGKADWKEKLLANYSRLVHDTDLERTLDSCFSGEIFTEEEKELVESVIPNTSQNKRRKFLQILLQKSEKDYDWFLCCLSEIGHAETVTLIKQTHDGSLHKEHGGDLNPNLKIVRRKLFSNREQIISRACLDPLLDRFISERLFDITDRERVENVQPDTTEQKNKNFLNILFSKGLKGCQIFLDELNHNGQDDLVKVILDTAVDDSVDEEIENYLREQKTDHTIPENIRVLHGEKINTWYLEDKAFVQTRASEGAKKAIESSELTVITGPPGCGKSAVAHHIALELRKAGYQIFPVISVSDIIRYWSPDQRHCFVMDDVFGVHTVDELELGKWYKLLEELNICLRKSHMKIIITLRKLVFHDKRILDALSKFRHQNFDVSEPSFLLNSEEKQNIFEKHMLINGRDSDSSDVVLNCELFSFPLLCRLFAAEKESRLDVDMFFRHPFSVLQKEISHLKENCKLKYFGLLLCMIYDNELNESVVSIEDENKDNKIKRKTFLELCGLPRSTSRTEIKSNLDSLLGTYLVNESRSYRFIHGIIFDTVVSTLSQEFHTSILKHCSCLFIMKRIQLPNNIFHEDHQSYIILDEDLKGAWANRLTQDMENGHFYEVFFNICLQNVKYETVLAKSLQEKKSNSEIEKLLCTKIPSEMHKHIKHKIKELNAPDFDSLPVVEQIKCNFQTSIYNLLDEHECTPLHWAVAKNLQEIFKLTWPVINVSLKQEYSKSVVFMFMAVYSGNAKIVSTLIDSDADINKCLRNGKTPVYAAALWGCDKLVKLLIENGADINKCDNIGRTPLYAASYAGYENVVQVLIANGADMNIFKDWPPLCAAAYGGHISVVKIFAENGADINQCNVDGWSPIHVASTYGQLKMVKFLLGIGVAMEKADNEGRTPLHLASMYGHDKIVQLLAESGADVNKFSKYNRTPLYFASYHGHANVIQTLIQKGGDVNKSDDWSPLCAAAYKRDSDVVKLLIDHGANVNHCNNDGWTCLYLASINGMDEIVKTLINNGADVNISDNYGTTPLEAALKLGYESVVHILTNKGAVKNKSNNS